MLVSMCVATTLRSTSAHARICKVPEGSLKAAPLPPPNIFGMYLRNAPLNLRYTHRDNPADYSHPQHKNQSQTKNKSPNNTISSAESGSYKVGATQRHVFHTPTIYHIPSPLEFYSPALVQAHSLRPCGVGSRTVENAGTCLQQPQTAAPCKLLVPLRFPPSESESGNPPHMDKGVPLELPSSQNFKNNSLPLYSSVIECIYK